MNCHRHGLSPRKGSIVIQTLNWTFLIKLARYPAAGLTRCRILLFGVVLLCRRRLQVQPQTRPPGRSSAFLLQPVAKRRRSIQERHLYRTPSSLAPVDPKICQALPHRCLSACLTSSLIHISPFSPSWSQTVVTTEMPISRCACRATAAVCKS